MTNDATIAVQIDPEPPPMLATARTIMEAAKSLGITVRLVGGLAFWERCAGTRGLLVRTERSGDIDFVVRGRDRRRFERMLCNDFGVLLDPQLGSIPGEVHARFYYPDGKRLCDVSYDYFVYCHTIDLRARLSADSTTIPLAELLLSKLQIAEPGEKDTLDMIALVLDHAFAEHDGDTINLPILLRRCASDWSLERTVRLSIYHACVALLNAEFLRMSHKIVVAKRFLAFLEALEVGNKSSSWRWRSFRGGPPSCNRPETLPDPRPEDLRSAV